jgi:hypothetical protein
LARNSHALSVRSHAGQRRTIPPSVVVCSANKRYSLSENGARRDAREGAQPGQYVVLITLVPQPTDATLERGVGDLLGNKYRDPSTSKLRTELRDGVPDLPPIKLAATDLKVRR